VGWMPEKTRRGQVRAGGVVSLAELRAPLTRAPR
jgi:hypothetical protein